MHVDSTWHVLIKCYHLMVAYLEEQLVAGKAATCVLNYGLVVLVWCAEWI